MIIAISMILLFVGIGVLILIHICIVGRAYRRGIGTTNIVERGSLASNSMSHEDIEKLPSYAFQSKDKGTSPMECAVCLDNLKVGEKCRSTADFLKGGSISGGESSRYSESGRQELNAETAELAMILVPESDTPINNLSFETRTSQSTAQDSEQLSGTGQIDDQITSEVNVNISENSTELRVITQTIESINLVNEEIQQ
ncbi:uncharacterized protein LOC107009222 [Solanum pennellii]|uniref:Uncharacterized protein LOC107009222 n=1 Tax=Solanum pennellii TaxID=28526 RepID=A0ABM1V2T0_SOLPN|nr:uncharacterized protein LOC107009222 [Solanum pennellii]